MDSNHVANGIEFFQRLANQAPEELIKATRSLALLPDSIISATKTQVQTRKSPGKEQEQEGFEFHPEEIEKIFVGNRKSPITQKEEQDQEMER